MKAVKRRISVHRKRRKPVRCCTDDGHLGSRYNAAAAKGVCVMAKSQRYSKEFKLEAARLVVEHDYTFKEAAKRLGATD